MTAIAENPFALTPATVQRGGKRVRALSAGELVVDSRTPLLVWEHPYYPTYLFAESDLAARGLADTEDRCYTGAGVDFGVRIDGTRAAMGNSCVSAHTR